MGTGSRAGIEFTGRRLLALGLLLVSALWAGPLRAQTAVQIIGRLGDGAGNLLNSPRGAAVGADGNFYVVGIASDNAFRISPAEGTAGSAPEVGDDRSRGVGSARAARWPVLAGILVFLAASLVWLASRLRRGD